MSKEWLVTDHEFYVGLTLVIMITYGVKKFGPSVGGWLDAELDKRYKAALEGTEQQKQAYLDAIKG